jgi:uncharacterized membrane protein YwaF
MVWTNSQKIVLPIAIAIIIAISTILSILLNKKSEKIKIIPFMVISLILITLEVVKQIKAIGSYSSWTIPLHFCSTFLVWYAIAAFGKGRVREIGYSLSYVSTILFLIGYLTNPGTIIGNSNEHILLDFDSFHTFIYHNLLILFLALSIGLKMYKPSLKDVKWIVISFAIYFATATIIANMLDTNYANLLFNNFPPMESLRLKVTYPIYLLAMYTVFIGGAAFLQTVTHYLVKLFKKTKRPSK